MLSQRAKYALKAMICLAEHRGPEPMSVTEIARGRISGYRPDVVHGHDWQASMVPAYLRYGDM